MKVAALVLLALVAIVAADSYGQSYGHHNQDYQVPNWNRHESRDGYNHVKGDWWVELPGKSHIKNDYDIKSQERVSVSHGHSYGHNAGHNSHNYGHNSHHSGHHNVHNTNHYGHNNGHHNVHSNGHY